MTEFLAGLTVDYLIHGDILGVTERDEVVIFDADSRQPAIAFNPTALEHRIARAVGAARQRVRS